MFNDLYSSKYSLHRDDEIKEIRAFCNEVAFFTYCLQNEVGVLSNM